MGVAALEYASLIAGRPDEEGRDVAPQPPRVWRRRFWATGLALLLGGALVLAALLAQAAAGRGRGALSARDPGAIASKAAAYARTAEIEGSSGWWTCRHSHMGECGGGCCCDPEFFYSVAEAACLHLGQVPGSSAWLTCGRHMGTCGHGCCCHTGYMYDGEDRQCHHPINDFNNKLDSVKFDAQRGLYYAFATSAGQLVDSGQVESALGGWADEDTSFPLASASKLYTAFAAMRTMELKPRDFYPGKYVNKFRGWESFRQFPVHGSTKRADLTIHHLLTHTSGLPFGMRLSKEDIQKLTLFYRPGTKFGYTLGHRVVGWILRDFWASQPEGRRAGIKTVEDTYRWLIFEPLGLSEETRFDRSFELEFGTSGEAGDAALASTGEDLMRLAVVALNRGRLPGGRRLISERNWDRWAVPNLLPGGRLTKDLVDWQGPAGSWSDWNVGGLKGSVMRQSGDYGWNYFGATYYGSREVGWCGFFSSCLRVSYPQRIAFVMMQRDVADLKKSKPFVVEHFDELARSLQCKTQSCGAQRGPEPVVCQVCSGANATGSCVNHPLTASCPAHTKRYSSLLHTDGSIDPSRYACYMPSCSR